ncbi:lipoprotein-anchoring transpeptidase ErfK/SrfK [Hoeflea marina]|uniref:Lipoprotein-anchoring transpeptidase ErfK/SrfK n=1 Tax=Hoeflea marina TaxID=274592 RepID=A0A317PCA7_9HYPH|nr:L,D-transpeptidase [Hoeflea marina]PWV95609.1 lipoprotein-anchoring transpeptidase ErfK/SrfK [Hoeflea marina]
MQWLAECDRRRFLRVAVAAAAQGLVCGARSASAESRQRDGQPDLDAAFDPRLVYAATQDNGIHVPAVNFGRLKPQFHRTLVRASEDMPENTIVIRLAEHHLYFVRSDRLAFRYGIGVGRDGFSWTGAGIISHQKAWPSWTPPGDMIERLPELQRYSKGMPGGLGNPLGARALYIYQGGADTLYRVHGTPEWWSIGKSMSSGCIRMINQDAIHLGRHVENGTPIIVS